MGTSNFHTENAQSAYVIDYGDNEYMWEEAQEHLGTWIKELDSTFELDNRINSESELRSYSTSSIGYWSFEVMFLNLTFEFKVNLFIRLGYYEAANLDYEFEWILDYTNSYEDIDSIISEIDEDPTTYNIKPELWTIRKSNLKQSLKQLESKVITNVENILTQISTPYGVVAKFSNGETIYEKL